MRIKTSHTVTRSVGSSPTRSPNITNTNNINHLTIKIMKQTVCKVIKKTGKVLIWPAKKYIQVMTKGYEDMFGENLIHVKFWM